MSEGAVDGAAYTRGLDGGGAGAGVVGLVEEREDVGAGFEACDARTDGGDGAGAVGTGDAGGAGCEGVFSLENGGGGMC